MMMRSRVLAEPCSPVPREEDLSIAGEVRVRQYWRADDASLPLVVFFHGGRFLSGNLDTHESLCRALVVFSGCRVAAVDYRLAPEHPFPAAVEDAIAAVDWALEQSPSVGVCGDSAGANLAAVAALARRDRLLAQVLIYPMLDPSRSFPSHTEFATGYGPGSEDMGRGWDLYLGRRKPDWRANPLMAADLSGAPPALVITAEYDSLRDEGEAYAQILADDDVDVQLVRCESVIHGFIGMTSFLRQAREVIIDCGEYLRKHLHGRMTV
jgi:acetyl esterase